MTAEKEGKVASSVYYEPEVNRKVVEFAERFGMSKSAAIELLTKKALGLVADNEMERIIMEAKTKV